MPFGRSGSPSPNRRSSIERLQKASRVKNSNILALEQKQEYDPTRIPQIERPLSKVQGAALGSLPTLGAHLLDSDDILVDGHSSTTSTMSPPIWTDADTSPLTPSRGPASPTKSSLSPSKFKGTFDHESGIWSADSSFNECELPIGRSLHRHAKSVTFDAAPPQINEYEMATPDISSIGTNSREGSYESIDDEEGDSILYDPCHVDIHEDSFDASLEDTDKTPVVGPDDWRGDGPMVRRSQYEQSPMPEETPSMAASGHSSHQRSDSAASSGDHRPLPPLPGAGLVRSHSTGSNRASPGLTAAAERMLGAHRSLPAPPPASTSKLDMQNIGNSKMTLEERLKLMMMSDDNSGRTAAEEQRERRLRRGAGRDRLGSPSSETETATEVDEADETIGDISALEDYHLPPRISRESIMRRVNGNKATERGSDYNFSSPAPTSSPQRSPARSPERLLPLDPDVPIPSTEDAMLDDIYEEDEESSVIITRNLDEDEYDEVSEMYDRSDLEEDEDQTQRPREEDEESHYSDSPYHVENTDPKSPTEPYGESSTPRAATPIETERRASLPELESDAQESDFSKDFESYMLPKTQELKDVPVLKPPRRSDAHLYLSRPYTPEQQLAKPDYDGSGWGEPEHGFESEPGTPDSVIRHSVPELDDEESDEAVGSDARSDVFVEEQPKELPAVPERIATVKASGSKLKTRPSNTPSDLAAMREARRQVSYEIPDVPAIPDKHHNRSSRDFTQPQEDLDGDDFLERHPSFKKSSLTLDLDLGLSLGQDLDRVIEAQKVNIDPPTLQTHNTVETTNRQASAAHCSKSDPKRSPADSSPHKQRGYLMRQNTKLVAASDKDSDVSWKTRSAGNSPVKQDRPESWTVEPCNSKPRQSSGRKRLETGPVPPLPGQQSNAQVLTQVEEEPAVEVAPESGERGRLFVKVMGVKDLDLPFPKSKPQRQPDVGEES